jgi:enhancer of mRNA-decapping protein 4
MVLNGPAIDPAAAKQMRDQQQQMTDRLITVMRQSGTMTPANFAMPNGSASSIEDTRQKMMALLQKGQLNSAFQLALCAADLNLLMGVCEAVNPSQLFEQKPCPLQQPVLLSLIQQLSQDLQTHADLKLRYLEEAVLNLDQSNVLTREHMPAVIQVLVQKLQQYMHAHPNDKTMKSVKMLLMASNSLLMNNK